MNLLKLKNLYYNNLKHYFLSSKIIIGFRKKWSYSFDLLMNNSLQYVQNSSKTFISN